MQTDQARNRSPESLVFLGIIAAAIGVLYFPNLRELFNDWSTNPDYSHGFIVPIASIYLVWMQRERIRHASIAPSYWGLLLLLAGAAQYSLGYIGAEHFLQSTSIMVVILGVVLFLYGKEISRVVLVPVVFLIFMIPLPAIIWNSFAFSLKLFATKLAVFIIQALGIVVLREGNVVYFPAATLEVVDACSGLRSLMSLLALGVLFGYVTNLQSWKKLVLVLCAIPIAILSNIIRLTVTAVLLVQFNIDITRGIYHTISGLVVFMIGLLLFMGVYKLITLVPGPAARDI